MLGVYLVAAELSRLGFIVSPTSRSSKGADLLVTDQACSRAFSVQVKTNSKKAGFWLLNANTKDIASRSHIYVFVNLLGANRPECYVVPSLVVAARMKTSKRKTGSVWYGFHKKTAPRYYERWQLFGNAS